MTLLKWVVYYKPTRSILDVANSRANARGHLRRVGVEPKSAGKLGFVIRRARITFKD